ncbi:MAG: glycosyltransferase family 39 protein [Anaerolineae bacterium]|jgi:mannosyltransferase
MKNKLEDWTTRRGIPALILIVSFALRLLRLGDANLWWDEGLAIWAVRKGFMGVTLWTAADVHPPLYFWSLWAWVHMLGESEFAMRAISAMFGVLTVAVVYALGVRLAGRAAGTWAALFTGLSRFHIWWSQEMRMYVLAGLMGTLSLYLFFRWLEKERISGRGAACCAPTADVPDDPPPRDRSATGWLAATTLASIGALYTIFLMAPVLLVQNLIVLLVLVWPGVVARRGRLVLRWAISQIVVGAALGGWLLLSWGRMRTWSVAGEPMGLRMFTRLYATLLTTGISVHIENYTRHMVLPFAVLALGGLLLLLRRFVRHSHPSRPDDEATGLPLSRSMLGALALVLTILLSGVTIYLSSLPRGLFYTPRIEARYFLPFAPAFWLLLGWAVAAIGQGVGGRLRAAWRVAGSLAGVAVLVPWLMVLPGYYEGRMLCDELQSMVRGIVSQVEPGDTVVLDSGGRYPMFLYYYERFDRDLWRPPMETVTMAEAPLSAEEVEGRMSEITAVADRVWLAEVEVHLTDPDRLVRSWLEARYGPPLLVEHHAHNTLYLYGSPERGARLSDDYRPQFAADMSVGDGILRGWELPVHEVGGDGTARVTLLWDRIPTGAVEVALVNPAGAEVLRRRVTSAAGDGRRQTVDLPVTPAMPPGHYSLRLLPDGGELGTLDVRGTERAPMPTMPQAMLDARLGEGIVLEGYALHTDGRDPRVVAGRLVLDLYWRAEDSPAENCTVFVQLLGEAHNPRTQGPVWAQSDAQPGGNRLPTGIWQAGETLIDRHWLILDEETPPGEYRLIVGMYRPEDGSRLPVSWDGQVQGDHVALDMTVTVPER